MIFKLKRGCVFDTLSHLIVSIDVLISVNSLSASSSSSSDMATESNLFISLGFENASELVAIAA